jgi:hypothetical protein
MKDFMKNRILPVLATVCFSCLGLLTNAQGNIDEDFLDDLEKNAKFMLTEQDAAFNVNATPAKWDKESAVIIGYSRNVLFDRQSRGGFLRSKERSLWFLEKDHLKIKLNDNNSVQSFSEIYFRYGNKEDGFIARIIKPDGTIENINLKSAVGVDRVSDVPSYFQSFFDKVAYSQYDYYKVPVAGLEPGDILEYVTTTKSRLDVTLSGYIEFTPVYEVCSKNYPIMHNEIAIETDDKSFFKFLSLNGAPPFTKQPTNDKDFFHYVFVDKNREIEKDVNFISPYLNYPYVKFQVIYSSKDEVKGALVGEKGELKSQFSKEELAKKAWEDYESTGYQTYRTGVNLFTFVDQSWSELAKLGAKSWTDQQYINNVYYYLRNKVVFSDSYLSDKVFAFMFGSLLFQRDIKSEVIISISNDVGKLKDVLFDQEIRYVIKVGDKLYFNVTDFSNPGDLSESLLDNEAYIINKPAKKGGAQEIKPFTLPGTQAADNSTDVAIKAELSSDMKKLMVIRTSTTKGLQKSRAISEALRFTPYMVDDYKNYGGNSPVDNLKSKQIEEYNDYVKTLKEEYKKAKPDFVKQSIESEYGETVDNVHFDIVTDGRTQKKNTLVVKDGFEIPSLVRKAGKKYMVNVMGLIGSQLHIKNEERDRKYDIDVRYAKTLTWSINFKIPDGYAVKGLTELNSSVDNETGSFALSAKEDAGEVVIKITKVYKQKNIPKNKWQDMLSFIDAAYNSSFKYILLTPKQ